MPLPRIKTIPLSLSKLPTTIKPKTLSSLSQQQQEEQNKTHLPPPTHDHIAQLIKDQNNPTQAIQTFKWANTLPNFTHNQFTYRVLIYKLCIFRRFEDAHQLLDEMSASIGSPPDETTFVTLVRGLGRGRRVREVVRVVELVKKFGGVLSLKVYNSILDVLVKEDIDIARGFFRKKMMECGVNGDEYTYGILMKGLCLTNRIGDGFKLLQVMKSRGLEANVTVYNTLVNALCKLGKVGRARSLMSDMVEVNDVSFNIMISAYCMEGNVVQAQVMVEKCFASGFVPDVVTVTKVVELLCSTGRENEAAEVLERVESSGGRIDVVAYNTLIKGFCSLGKPKVGLHFKKHMEIKGYLPNVDTYTTLITGFCDIDLLDSSVELFNEMKTEAISPNFTTYDTLIRGFCSRGRVDDGFKTLELMEESKGGSGGHISPYNSIIYGLYSKNRNEEALDFLKQMERMFPRAVNRTLRILQHCEEGNIESAKEVYDQMIHEGGIPSVYVYSSLIQGFCQHNNVREAFGLMNEMVGCGYLPDTSTNNAIIHGFCFEGKVLRALKLIEDMIGRGCLLDVGTYSPVLVALSELGEDEKALKIVEEMVEKAIAPDYCTWNSLICCVSQKSQWQDNKYSFHLNKKLQKIIND